MNQTGNMFYITVSNGLLEAEHWEKMGAAVWQFMWCLDKLTRIDEDGTGWVLGGKPINLDDIPFGSRNTNSRNLNDLEKNGYVKLIHTPYGISIRLLKAKKRFTKNDKPKRFTENGEPRPENGEPNKTVSVDTTPKIAAEPQESEFEVIAEEDTVPTRDFVKRVKPPRKMHKPVFALWKTYPPHWALNRAITDAADRLYHDKGVEKIKKALTFYEDMKDDKFCPKIYTPLDLEEKWDKLITFRDRV